MKIKTGFEHKVFKEEASIQYIDFKVTLYRLKELREIGFGFGLDVDLEDLEYNFFVTEFEEDEKFKERIKTFYERLLDVKDGKLRLDDLFNRYDLTPFLIGITANFELYTINSCTLTFSGLQRIDDISGIKRFVDPSITPFEFREMDLISIKATTSTGKPIEELKEIARRDLKEIFEDRPLEDLEKAIDIEVYTPYFRGFVTKVTRQTSIDGVDKWSVVCQGIMKLLSSTAVIEDLALVENFLAISKNFDIINPQMLTVWQSRFMDKNAKEIFSMILREVYLAMEATNKKELLLNINEIFRRADETIKNIKFSFHPLTIRILQLFYCMIKEDILHPSGLPVIATFDDEIKREVEDEILDTGRELTPYLIMTQNNRQLWESRYTYGLTLLNQIRETTFFEIFESRKGVFHFRAPKFNERFRVIEIEPSRVLSYSFEKSDSAVHAGIGLKNLAPLIGPLRLPARVYLNRFLVSKYGFRIPRILENPNVLEPYTGDILARFMSDFYNSQSRTLSITKIFDETISVGDLIFLPTREEGPNTGFVGYVASIRESVEMGQRAIQDLSCIFVRRAVKYERVKKTVISADHIAVLDYLQESRAFSSKLLLLKPIFMIKEEKEIVKIIEKIEKREEMRKVEWVKEIIGQTNIFVFRPIMNLFDVARLIKHENLAEIEKNVLTVQAKREEKRIVERPSLTEQIDRLGDEIRKLESMLKEMEDRLKTIQKFKEKVNDLLEDTIEADVAWKKEILLNWGIKRFYSPGGMLADLVGLKGISNFFEKVYEVTIITPEIKKEHVQKLLNLLNSAKIEKVNYEDFEITYIRKRWFGKSLLERASDVTKMIEKKEKRKEIFLEFGGVAMDFLASLCGAEAELRPKIAGIKKRLRLLKSEQERLVSEFYKKAVKERGIVPYVPAEYEEAVFGPPAKPPAPWLE